MPRMRGICSINSKCLVQNNAFTALSVPKCITCKGSFIGIADVPVRVLSRYTLNQRKEILTYEL